MLLEIARGNLSYRIPLDNNDKQFNEVAGLLNKVAKKMQLANYLHPHHQLSNPILLRMNSVNVIIKKVQDYILNHLEEPLPSAKELSRMFGTNEFTLKENFRDIVKTTIYQFYLDERLKKGYFLIENTLTPLKEIAYTCGFNDYNNFSKAFKKKYGYTPGDVERKLSKGTRETD